MLQTVECFTTEPNPLTKLDIHHGVKYKLDLHHGVKYKLDLHHGVKYKLDLHHDLKYSFKVSGVVIQWVNKCPPTTKITGEQMSGWTNVWDLWNIN